MFHRRAFILGGFAGVGALALIGRLADLQLVEGARYQLLSNSNQFNFRIRPPPRGRILDRNGVELASNRPDFRVLYRKGEAKEDPADTLTKVADLIPITDQKQQSLLKEIENTPKASPVALANDLSWDDFTRINVRTPELPGVAADMTEARVYPFGGAFAHVIGYVAKVSAEDVDREKGPDGKPDRLLLDPGFRIGKQGVEKSLDLQLRGRPGGQKVEVDSMGRVVREDPSGDIHATPGKDVMLTLDADIQNRALEVFGPDSGAAVMMDVRTGDILCMLSAPSFDANQFVSGVPSAEYRALADYDRKPLLNKALAGLYHPGSTFKTMVSLAALEVGVDPQRTYTCNGAFTFGNHTYHCDQHHGTLDMHGAIVTSCDVFFYQTALSVGPDKIAGTTSTINATRIVTPTRRSLRRRSIVDLAVFMKCAAAQYIREASRSADALAPRANRVPARRCERSRRRRSDRRRARPRAPRRSPPRCLRRCAPAPEDGEPCAPPAPRPRRRALRESWPSTIRRCSA